MPRFSLPSAAPWFNCAVGPDGFVALAGIDGTNSDKAATSPDGETWTARTLPASRAWGGYYRAFCYDPTNDVFVALDVTSANIAKKCAISSDGGVNWSEVALPDDGGTNLTWASLAVDDAGRLVAVGQSNATFPAKLYSAYSDDGGSTWSALNYIADVTGSGVVSGMCWGNGLYFVVNAVGEDDKYFSSTDGVTWSSGTLPSSHFWLNPSWNGSVFYVSTDDSTEVAAVSSDLSAWTEYALPPAGFGAHYYGSAAFTTGVIGSANGYGEDFTRILIATGNGASQAIHDLEDDPDYLDWYGIVADPTDAFFLMVAEDGYAYKFYPPAVGEVNRYFHMFP